MGRYSFTFLLILHSLKFCKVHNKTQTTYTFEFRRKFTIRYLCGFLDKNYLIYTSLKTFIPMRNDFFYPGRVSRERVVII